MATPSATEELEALELARSRLEAALSGDEYWRALSRSRVEGDDAADSAAHRARNTRLEMALADNAHYQAWKHLNGAIDALRTRRAPQAQAAGPLVRPAPADQATHESAAIADDVEAILHAGAQRAEAGPEPAAPAGPSPSAHPGLVGRLARLEEPPEAEAKPAGRPDGRGGEEDRRDQGRVRPSQRQAQPIPADPPEASVTFVVRETRTPLLPSAELPSDLGTERNSALFDRLRSLNAAPEPTGQTYSPADAADEEAEVTIVSVEDLRRRREADDRVGIVRRFRKALSGD